MQKMRPECRQTRGNAALFTLAAIVLLQTMEGNSARQSRAGYKIAKHTRRSTKGERIGCGGLLQSGKPPDGL